LQFRSVRRSDVVVGCTVNLLADNNPHRHYVRPENVAVSILSIQDDGTPGLRVGLPTEVAHRKGIPVRREPRFEAHGTSARMPPSRDRAPVAQIEEPHGRLPEHNLAPTCARTAVAYD
jgi:hypothetical protein